MARIVIWSFGLVVLLVIMGVAIAWLRRQMSSGEPAPAKGFTLGDLRELHRKGKMTDAEFEAAKGLILKDLKQSVQAPERPNRTSGPGRSA